MEYCMLQNFRESVMEFLSARSVTTWYSIRGRRVITLPCCNSTPHLDFTNWNTNEPNDYGNGEDCVHLRPGETSAGTWNDHRCDYDNCGYICRLDKGERPKGKGHELGPSRESIQHQNRQRERNWLEHLSSIHQQNEKLAGQRCEPDRWAPYLTHQV